MSESDGRPGLRLIRPATPDLVVLDSGDAIPDTARRLEAAGATMFFVKPIQIAEFLDAVNQLLSRAR